MDLGIAGRAALVVAGLDGAWVGPAAEALAGEGVRVMLSSRSGDEPRCRGRGHCGPPGAEVATTAADITDPRTPALLVEATMEAFGSVDIVVANAGGPPPGRALDVDDAQLDAALNANLLSGRPADPGGRAPHAGSGWGRCLLHHLLLGGAAGADAGPLQHRPHRAVGLGEDGGPGPGGRRERDHPQPALPRTPCHRPDEGAGRDGSDGGSGRLRAASSPSCAREQAGFVNGAALVVDGGSTLAL